MALADDIARWTWHKGHFKEIFGVRDEGRSVERWLAGKSTAVLPCFDLQAHVDTATGLSNHPNAFWESGTVNFCAATEPPYDAQAVALVLPNESARRVVEVPHGGT